MCTPFILGQIPNFEPVYPPTEPIPLGKSYNPKNPFPDRWDYFPQLKNPLAWLLESQKQQAEQQRLATMQQFNMPMQSTQVEMKDPMAEDKKRLRRQQLFDNTLNDFKLAHVDYPNMGEKEKSEFEPFVKNLLVADLTATTYKSNFNHFNLAYSEIKQMLEKKKPLSLKRAVFLVENAYYQNKLNYTNFCAQIDEIKQIILDAFKKSGVNPNDKVELHRAVQNLYQISFKYSSTNGKEQVFQRLSYDFDDFWGDKDYSKQFVTKLLKTHTGQCHSLPLLYLILCEELDLEAYLAFAPNHSYIKFPFNNNLYCFETTSGAYTDDNFVVKSGYINATAIKNQIYLAPLSKIQTIATCLIDLSAALEELEGKSDFSLNMAQEVLKYYPNSVSAVMIFNNVQVAYCAKAAEKYNFPKVSELDKYPQFKEQYNSMINWELNLEGLGYTKIPKEEYERWLKEAEQLKQQQEEAYKKQGK